MIGWVAWPESVRPKPKVPSSAIALTQIAPPGLGMSRSSGANLSIGVACLGAQSHDCSRSGRVPSSLGSGGDSSKVWIAAIFLAHIRLM